MNKCTDHKLGDMLHAYELGLLSDEDRARFEMHMMECDYCYEQAEAFKTEADQLRERPEMVETIKEIVESHTVQEIETEAPKKRWPRIIPIFAAAAIVILVLVLQPGKIEIQYSDEAVAHANRVAVMYFENLADPQDSQRLGEIATNLLIADLAESRYMQVVSSQRMYDLLQLQGYKEKKAVDKEVASRIAKKAQARWILTGNILQTEPHLELATQLIDASTGDVVASQAISGRENEGIFALIDELTGEIKRDMSLPPKALEENDRDVADITSHSEQAYRLYLVGLDYVEKLYTADAARSLREALSIDSTMAMAYYHLAPYTTGSEQREIMKKAVKYSDKVSWKDRQYIMSRNASMTGDDQESISILKEIIKRYPDEKEAYFQIGTSYRYDFERNDSAIVYMNKVIALDSISGRAYNMLAYAYNDLGDLEKALQAIDQYIAVAPNEANPYDSKSDILTQNGRIPEAIEAAEKAVEIKPDMYYTVKNLGILYVYNKQYEKAAECFLTLASGNNTYYRMMGRQLLPCISIYQGKFDEALKVIDDTFAADRIEQRERSAATILKMTMQLYIYYFKGDYETGLTHSLKAIETHKQVNPYTIVSMLDGYVHFLVASGDIDKAKSIAEEIRADIEARDPETMDHYWYVMGTIKFGEKEYDSAAEYYGIAAEIRKDPENLRGFITRYWLARAYQEAGSLEQAATIYELLQSAYNEERLFWAPASVMSYYYLGKIYETMGRENDAIRQYRKFIDIWKNADNGREFIEDARRSLANLGG